jgi:myo-inositol-1(or 4)-monophosphatase
MSREQDLERIAAALKLADTALERFTPGEIEHRLKAKGDPVTEADEAVNDVLLATLPQDGEGWLSEETVDEPSRLSCHRTWIVDPIDGTKEFVKGIPEWSVSIGLVEGGDAVAGGISIPSRGLHIIGSLESGVLVNGEPCRVRDHQSLDGISILASRSELRRGQWDRFDDAPFGVTPMGSVACKMALVAAGLADATWTLVPKNEWDVAAGTALVRAAGGAVWRPDGVELRFNQPKTLLPGLIAVPAGIEAAVREYLA